MNREYKHTFVIIAYKESPYIEECIQSLLNQTIKSQIHITTSTPSEYLRAIAKKYKLPLHINNVSAGIASDWMYAYDSTATRFVTLAHQDDLYDNRYAEKCLAAAAKKENNLITFTGYKELFNGVYRSNTLNLLVKRLILFPFFLFKNNIASSWMKKRMFSFGNSISCPSVMYNKDTIGEFTFNEKLENNLDWDAWLTFAERKGCFVYVKDKLMVHRIHENSESSENLRNNTRQQEDYQMFKKVWPAPLAKIISKIYSLSYASNWK